MIFGKRCRGNGGLRTGVREGGVGAREVGGVELSTKMSYGEEEELCGNEGSENTGWKQHE